MSDFTIVSLAFWFISLVITSAYLMCMVMEYDDKRYIIGANAEYNLRLAFCIFLPTLFLGWLYLVFLPIIVVIFFIWALCCLIKCVFSYYKIAFYKNGKFIGIMSLWKKD